MKNKIISIILSVLIIFSVAPIFPTVFATPASASGIVGSNGEIEWTFTADTGRLSFSLKDGYTEGKIPSYSYSSNSTSSWSNAPWNNRTIDYRPYVKTVWINSGITSVGDYAFTGMTNINGLYTYSVTEYGDGCFKNCIRLRCSHVAPSKLVNFSSYENADLIIGASAFENCGSAFLTEGTISGAININPSNYSFNSITIKERALANASISQCALLANEVYIGECAFEGSFKNYSGTPSSIIMSISKNLTDGNIYMPSSPANIVSISSNAFKNAYLEYINICVTETLDLDANSISNITEAGTISINSYGASPIINCANANSECPAISGDFTNFSLYFEGNTSTVDVPNYLFGKMPNLVRFAVDGNVNIKENNSINSLSEECDLAFDKDASNCVLYTDLIAGSTSKFIITGTMSSNVHKYAIDNDLTFYSSDNGDFAESAPGLYNFKSDKSQTSISFSWTKKTCAYYYIYRKTSLQNDYTLIKTIPFYETSFTDSGLTPGLKYTYKVSTEYNETFGPCSTESSYQLMSLTETVKATVATANDKNILSFTGISGADKYNIYSGSTLITTLDSNESNSYSYTFSDTIKYGKEYQYSIEPIRLYEGENQVTGKKVSVTHTPKVTLNKKTITCVDNTFGKLTLSWGLATNANGYKMTVTHNGESKVITINNKNTTSYNLTLTDGGLYEISMCSYRDYQTSAEWDKISIVVMSSIAPKLTATVSQNCASLKWDAVIGADKYIVERYNGSTWEQLTTITTSTECTNKNLLYGKEYRYRVYAVKLKTSYGTTDYQTPYSNEVTIKPVITVDTPVLSISETTSKSVVLSWTSANNANKYVVYRQTDSNGKYEALATVTSTSYTDSRLEAGKSYQYIVRAYRDYCASPNDSNPQSYITLATNSPLITVEKAQDSAKITWDTIQGASGYEIYRKSDGEYSLLAKTTSLLYIDNTVEYGKTYSYKVRPYKSHIKNSTEVGTMSDEALIRLLDSLDTPKINLYKKSNKTVLITWNSVLYATDYIIQRKTESGSWTNIAVVSGEMSYIDTDIKGNVVYEYRVAAKCYSIQSSFSSSQKTQFIGNDISFMLSSEQKIHTTTIAISPKSSIDQYEVYKRIKGGNWTLLCKTSKSLITDKNCLHGTTYEYRLRLYDNTSDGIMYSDYSDVKEITFAVSVASLKPKLKVQLKNNSTAKLSWNQLSGVSYYRIYRKANGGKWKYLIASSSTSFTNKKLLSGVEYSYKIVPIGAFDFGKTSNICSVTTLEKKAIKITAKCSGNTITLTWKKVKGASGYDVYFATSKNPKFKKYSSTKKVSTTIKKVKKNNTYYCFIRPYKIISNKKVYGKKSYVAIVKKA